MISTPVAVVNLVLGLAYVGYGVMTAAEMRRDWRSLGFTHFGVAWLFMAFTCGPHHLVHAVHIAVEGRQGGPLDLLSVVVGLPVGVIWLGLRIEAFTRGRGDRFIAGTPIWLRATAWTCALYLAGLSGAAAVLIATGWSGWDGMALINLALVAIYTAIGWFLLRTQLSNRGPMGGWSLSGISLTAVFPTCALMHGIWVVYSVRGVYAVDGHGLLVDLLSIPAGCYFLWVVRSLHRDELRDWNRLPEDVQLAPAAPA